MQVINRDLLFKRRLQARVSSQAALQNNQFLLDNVEHDLLDRISIITRAFKNVAHIGGYHASFAKKMYDQKVAPQIINVEQNFYPISENSQYYDIIQIFADDEMLPLKPKSLDLITSSLSFQFINDLPGLLSQIMQSLKPDGLLAANFIGGNSLYELKESLLMAESEILGGASSRILPFIDVQQMGSLLQRAKFALPVVDMDRLTIRYEHMFDLIKDIRAMGASNCLFDKHAKPLSRAVISRAAQLYQQNHAQADGRIPASFDIINIIGWSPHESQQKPLKPGSAKHQLSDFL